MTQALSGPAATFPRAPCSAGARQQRRCAEEREGSPVRLPAGGPGGSGRAACLALPVARTVGGRAVGWGREYSPFPLFIRMFCWLKIFIDNQTWVITGFNTGATACDFSTDLSGRLNSYTPSQAVWTPIVIIFLEWVSAGLSRRGSAQWGGELHPPARRSHRPTFFLYLFHICSASAWPLLPLSNAVLHIFIKLLFIGLPQNQWPQCPRHKGRSQAP